MSNEITPTPEVVSTDAVAVKQVKQEQEFWPGKINYVDSRGHHPGATCKLLTTHFANKDLGQVIDEYFRENTGMLLLDVKPIGENQALVFYTRVLAPEDLEDFQEVQKVAQGLIDEKRAKEKAQAYEAEKKMRKEIDDRNAEATKRLKQLEIEAEQGRIHMNNCKKKKG